MQKELNPIILRYVSVQFLKYALCPYRIYRLHTLKGLSHEIDFKNVDENGQILALTRAAAGFWIFRRLLWFLV